MPDTKTAGSIKDIPKREPGILVGVEWKKKPRLQFSESEQNSIKELVRKLKLRETAARREQIIRVWEKRLFDRGFQHILIQRNGGWGLPAQGTGYGYGEENSKTVYELNIYNSYGQILIGALTREVPTVRFKPRAPDDDAGITAARSAEALKEAIVRRNKILTMLEDVTRYLYVDGLMVAHTYYMRDAQRFGYLPEPKDVVPEDEEKADEADRSEAEHAGADESDGEPVASEVAEGAEQSDESESGHDQDDGEDRGEGGEKTDEGETEETPGEEREEKQSNGSEVIEVDGALEWKLPIKKKSLCECGYAMRCKEIDTAKAKAKYPEVADKLTSSKGGPGGDDLDRLARVNVDQGMMNSYNTQDSESDETTECKCWIRPWQLIELDDTNRTAIIDKCPKGLYVTFCGETYCEAYDESMDAALTLLHALPGDGMNRAGLGDWLMPVQKALNNWMELANDYFVRGVPAKWMDNEMFDVEGLKEQINLVGDVHPFQREQGVTMEQVIWEETPPQFPEQMIAFINDFKGDLAQLLCGAFPALFGGDSTPTDSPVGTTMIQRDQALGRIGIPWRRLKEAVANIFMHAVSCLAENHEQPISVVGKVSVTVEMADLQGDMAAFPEVDENFPETQTQKANQVAKVIAEAATNPMLAEICDDPDNLESVRDAIGLEGWVIPALEDRDKQLGEIEVMLNSPPIPNPAIEKLEEEMTEIATAARAALAAGDQQKSQQLIMQGEQLEKQKATLPPLVSSESIDIRCDNHEVEAMTTLRFINSARGRSLKHGNDEERQSFENIRLHYIEHDDQAKKEKAEAQKPPPPKPPSISFKGPPLSPDAAAQSLAQAGIKADPQKIATDEATRLAAEHPQEQVPVPA
jgi:hypothetical protein